jgi:hypothetical protein
MEESERGTETYWRKEEQENERKRKRKGKGRWETYERNEAHPHFLILWQSAEWGRVRQEENPWKDSRRGWKRIDPTRTPSFFGSSRNEGERERKRNVGKIAGEFEN